MQFLPSSSPYRYYYMDATTWTLTKRPEKKLDGNYRRMLRAIVNKSWRQHPHKVPLHNHLPPITKTIQVRRIHKAMYSYWPPHMAEQNRTTSSNNTHSSVRIRDVAPEDLPEGMNDRREVAREGQGYHVLAARHDDDIYIIYDAEAKLEIFHYFNERLYYWINFDLKK